MVRVRVLWMTLICCLISVAQVCAAPRLPRVLGDHMVLQRGRPIHIWGWADAGETVRVTMLGQARQAVADRAGQWSVSLPSRPAGGPFTITVTGTSTIVLHDVLVGDVWLASGQSNMTFALNGVVNAATELPRARWPEIRLFTVPRRISFEPRSDVDIEAVPPFTSSPTSACWHACTPEAASKFSAVAYFFARDLYTRLGIPIGVIESAWPGTAADEWTPPSALSADASLAGIVKEWQLKPLATRLYDSDPAAVELEFCGFELLKNDVAVPFCNFENGRAANTLGGTWAYDWDSALSSSIELVSIESGPHGTPDFALRLHGTIDHRALSMADCLYAASGAPVDMRGYTGLRFWMRGRGLVRLRSNQPTSLDWDNYASDYVAATPTWREVTVRFKDLKQAGWGKKLPFTPEALTGFSLQSLAAEGDVPRPPGGLYFGMISPMLEFPVRGVIWYQGESDAGRALQYRTLLPALIDAWRAAWHIPDLPFLIVQLPNLGVRRDAPEDSAWAELREAQLLTLRQPHTGLAVTFDVGEADDLHPHDKASVGARLARWALGAVYGQAGEYSGPLYASMRVEGNRVRIVFTHVGGGLVVQHGQLQGFTIAGADRHFHAAQAMIDQGGVVVWSPAVSRPVAVRYAWADNPYCTLYNKEGLPASPFRTDDWPGITK